MRALARADARPWWFVTRKYPPAVGGMERLSWEVTTRLARRRPVRVIAMRPPVSRLPGFVIASALRVMTGCVRSRMSLLHVGDPVLAPVAAIARAFRVPTAVTLHGLDLVYPRLAYRAYLRAFLRGFDAYVCISDAARRAAIDIGIPGDRIHVIGIGVDAPLPANDPATRDENRLLFIGRLVRRKGLAWFVRDVLPRVVGARPSLRLAILGEGPERKAIAKAAEETGVAEHLIWLGAADEATKADQLARAAICVVPNIAVDGDIEGFGIVALEAAAAGCPLLASRLEGLCDAVVDGESGTLLPAGDVGAWTDAITRWLSDPQARAEAGRNAREHVAARGGWDAIIDRYECLLLQVAGGALTRGAR
jgi:phosphatidylinositol alpha-1,6-mannosyltransferase